MLESHLQRVQLHIMLNRIMENGLTCGHAQSADTGTQIVKTSVKIVEAIKTNRLTMPLMMRSNTPNLFFTQ